MKIWYDACTGKHVRYGVAVARRLRESRHEVILTTRKHPDTLPLAEFLKEKFVVAGEYDPTSLLTRLREGSRRQLEFCKLFQKDPPSIAISHGSVDQCRFAFGLKIPVVVTLDTPRAEAVHRLTLPLADVIIASRAIPTKILDAYNIKGKILSFDGVDEVAWIKDHKPERTYDFEKPLIVMRELEEKAVYARKNVDMLSLARRLAKLSNVMYLSRYSRKQIGGLTVPKYFVDSASLVAQADLFIGVGGTISREAALQGTPAITIQTFKQQYVNEFLAEKGFPIFRMKHSDAFERAQELIGKKHNVTHLLAELENPVDVIASVLSEIRQD